MTFELTPRGTDVLLVPTHRRLGERANMVSVASGWHSHLAVLGDVLNGVVPPSFWSIRTPLEADYEKRFVAG